MTGNIQLAGYSVKGSSFPFRVQTAATRAVSHKCRALEEASDTSQNDSECSWAFGTTYQLCPTGGNVHAQVTGDTGTWSVCWGNDEYYITNGVFSLLH